MNMARGFLVPAEHGNGPHLDESVRFGSFLLGHVHGVRLLGHFDAVRAAGSGKVQKLVEVLEAFHLHAVDFSTMEGLIWAYPSVAWVGRAIRKTTISSTPFSVCPLSFEWLPPG